MSDKGLQVVANLEIKQPAIFKVMTVAVVGKYCLKHGTSFLFLYKIEKRHSISLGHIPFMADYMRSQVPDSTYIRCDIANISLKKIPSECGA